LQYEFKFDLLGPRVPAVLISPGIAPRTVDQAIYDHSSIPATVRKVFQIPDALTMRDQRANTFENILNLDKPRRRLPRLEEPFIDEAERSLAEGLELRESLAWIVKDMIWQQVLALPKIQQESFAEDGFKFSVVGAPDLEAQMIEEIMTEIGPQLSSHAQEVLSEPTASSELEFSIPGAVLSKLAMSVNIVKYKVEKLLEDISLVDDAAVVADWFLRKYIQDHNVILHRADGLTLPRPDEGALRSALADLFAQKDPRSKIWLADHLDRWLTIHADGQVVLHDQEPEGVFVIESLKPEATMELLKEMVAGRISAVRTGFGR
jgi:hypothetical protein